MDPTLILHELQALNDDRIAGQPAARAKLLAAAQKLAASLQTPSELVARSYWTEPAKSACIRAAIDLKIFDTLTRNGDGGASAAELAKPSGAETSMVARIMKHLAATWIVEEVGPDCYRHTPATAQLSEPKFADGVITMHDVCGPSILKLPAYLTQTSWADPSNSTDGPFQYAFGIQHTYWQWLAENPPYLSKFANYMSAYRNGKLQWFSPTIFPVQSILIDQASSSKSGVVLVDVGGGKGHDLLALLTAFPDLGGKLILQDLPDVIGIIEPPLPSSIKAMPHDFFTPQPVQHARSYFFHSIFHDWDDEHCIQILKALKPALKPGYSKILVHDHIIAEKGADAFATSMDLLMCCVLSARERTESQFKALFDAAGLKVDKIWHAEPGVEAVIEASLPA